VSEPSITITGVPASVSRAQVIQALEVLGLDPYKVVSFSGEGSAAALHVEVYSDGRPDVPGWRWTHDGKEMATHRLTIPVIDKEAT
jgi:hypothetical protein